MRQRVGWMTAALAVLFNVLLPAPVPAQVAGAGSGGIPPVPDLPLDTLVWITRTDGREQQGRIEAISPAGLRISELTGGAALDWSDVGLLKADVNDPVADGFWNGALTGGLSAAGFAGFVVALVCSIEGCDASNVTRFALVWTGFGAGGGAIAGALIDRAHPTRQVVYPRATRTIFGDVRLGERVWLTMNDGRELQGTLLEASASNLALAEFDRRIPVPLAGVRSIAVERSDGLGNGMRNGFLSGAGSMAGLLLAAQTRNGSCCEWGTTLYWTAVGGGIGTLAGAGVDALLTSRTVAARPAAGVPAALQVAPVFHRGGGGVQVSLRW